MKKSHVKPTTARNLERKFDRGEDVLDYFDVRKGRVIKTESGASAVKAKSASAYLVKPNLGRRAVVHEKPAGYRKQK